MITIALTIAACVLATDWEDCSESWELYHDFPEVESQPSCSPSTLEMETWGLYGGLCAAFCIGSFLACLAHYYDPWKNRTYDVERARLVNAQGETVGRVVVRKRYVTLGASGATLMFVGFLSATIFIFAYAS